MPVKFYFLSTVSETTFLKKQGNKKLIHCWKNVLIFQKLLEKPWQKVVQFHFLGHIWHLFPHVLNWSEFLSLSWHIWNIWLMFSKIASNGAFLAPGWCFFPKLRWNNLASATLLTLSKDKLASICYRVFSEITSIEGSFEAHAEDTSLWLHEQQRHLMIHIW